MRHRFHIPRLHITLLCAALIVAAAGQAQTTPDQTPEQLMGPKAAPVDATVDAPVDAPVDATAGSPKETPAETRPAASMGDRTPLNTADTPAADRASMTDGATPQSTPDPVKPAPATPDPATQTTATSETPGSEATDTAAPPDRWRKADRSGAPASAPPETNTPPDPLNAARRFWRGAVATGGTDLGFRAWVIAALGTNTTAADTGNDIDAGPAPAPPSSGAPVDSQASRTRDVSSRWLERAGPVALGAAGRVVTTFGAAIPTAFCAPFIVCYIELEAGEVLTDTPSWGDTARWQVTVKVQGSDPETVILEIKPSDDAGLTNLVIPTDRRLYTINLVNDPDVHTPILAFSYPDTAARMAAARIATRKAGKASVAASAKAARRTAAANRKARLAKAGLNTSAGLRDPGRLDFRFSVTGKAAFRPVRVYTDGRKTYIDLHPAYRGTLPTVVPGRGEENKALNTRVDAGGTRLVADRVIRDIWLQAGSRKVRIRRSAP